MLDRILGKFISSFPEMDDNGDFVHAEDAQKYAAKAMNHRNLKTVVQGIFHGNKGITPANPTEVLH